MGSFAINNCLLRVKLVSSWSGSLYFVMHYPCLSNTFPRKKVREFPNFGQGKPGKVRENHSLQVLTTMDMVVRTLENLENLEMSGKK